jgi:hypothetical protein
MEALQRKGEELQRKETTTMRQNIKVGGYTNCGQVFDVRLPMIGVQTPAGKRYIDISRLYAPTEPCGVEAAILSTAVVAAEEQDEDGRQIIRGPVYGGYYDNVHIISNSVGVEAASVTVTNSVIEAPICIRVGGVGATVTNNTLTCDRCIVFTSSVLMKNRLVSNRCSGVGTNRPDVFGW